MKILIPFYFILNFCINSNVYSQSEWYTKNINLAREYFSQEDYKKTIIYATKSLIEKPDDLIALHTLQSAYNYLEEYEMSLEYGNQIVKLHSNQTESTFSKIVQYTYYVQGLNFYFLGNNKNACSFFNTAILLSPNDIVLTVKQMKFVQGLCHN